MHADDLAVVVQLEHAVALGVGDPQPEHHRALGLGVLLQLLAEPDAVEDVVAEHERDVVVADEVGADQEGRRDAVRLGLHGVAERAAPLAAVAEQRLELRAAARASR